MKTLAILWALVVVTGTGTSAYVIHQLNDLGVILELQPAYGQVQPAASIDLGNHACLQNCKPYQLQPAMNSSVLETAKSIKN